MSRKIPEGLHSALYELLNLLQKYHSESDEIGEEDFQTLFEKYNYIWAVLGYSRLLAQPKCELKIQQSIEGDYIEPDFIAYNEIREQWEIVDLKLPKKSLQLSGRKRRKRFKSEIEDYIVQVQEYSRYFNENAHRQHVQSEHDARIPSNPPVVLVLGSGLDQTEINDQLDRYDHNISIIQYDTILKRLEKKFKEKSGEEGGLPGLTLSSCITLLEKPKNEREYIIDIGKYLDSERLSLYLTNDKKLTLEVISKSGLSIDVSVPWTNALEIGEQKVLYVEFASTENLSFARVFAGSEILDEMLLTMKVPFADIEPESGFDGVGDEFNLYMGSDLNGKNGASFGMHEFTVLSKAEEISERLKFMRYLLNRSENNHEAVIFEKNEYGYTKDSSDIHFPDKFDIKKAENKSQLEEYVG